jgi:hypothetical protein
MRCFTVALPLLLLACGPPAAPPPAPVPTDDTSALTLCAPPALHPQSPCRATTVDQARCPDTPPPGGTACDKDFALCAWCAADTATPTVVRQCNTFTEDPLSWVEPDPDCLVGVAPPPSSCESDVSGVRDCAILDGKTGVSLELCTACQGTPCGTDPSCDAQLPCVDGNIAVVGCCGVNDCTGIAPFCGQFLGLQAICVDNDDT